MAVQINQFVEQVVLTVREIGEVLFNIHSEEEFFSVFGISIDQLTQVILKIIEALPTVMFETLASKQLDELKNICAREYVFFQVQERFDDPKYQTHLDMFIRIFSKDMEQQLEVLSVKLSADVNNKEG